MFLSRLCRSFLITRSSDVETVVWKVLHYSVIKYYRTELKAAKQRMLSSEAVKDGDHYEDLKQYFASLLENSRLWYRTLLDAMVGFLGFYFMFV